MSSEGSSLCQSLLFCFIRLLSDASVWAALRRFTSTVTRGKLYIEVLNTLTVQHLSVPWHLLQHVLLSTVDTLSWRHDGFIWLVDGDASWHREPASAGKLSLRVWIVIYFMLKLGEQLTFKNLWKVLWPHEVIYFKTYPYGGVSHKCSGNCNEKQLLAVFVINEGGIWWMGRRIRLLITFVYSDIKWNNCEALCWVINGAGPCVRRPPAGKAALQSSPEHGGFQVYRLTSRLLFIFWILKRHIM